MVNFDKEEVSNLGMALKVWISYLEQMLQAEGDPDTAALHRQMIVIAKGCYDKLKNAAQEIVKIKSN